MPYRACCFPTKSTTGPARNAANLKEFAAFAGTKYAVALANGTFALDVALKAMDIGAGDDVIVTSRTFLASASAIVTAGANPVFADVDLNSQNISADTIQTALTPTTKAIIVVHLAGMPAGDGCHYGAGRKTQAVGDRRLRLAHGARYKGRPVGSIGHVGAWSFCQDKIMTTGGEGGMVTTNSKDLWLKCGLTKTTAKATMPFNTANTHPAFAGYKNESFGTNWRDDGNAGRHRSYPAQAYAGLDGQAPSQRRQAHPEPRQIRLHPSGGRARLYRTRAIQILCFCVNPGRLKCLAGRATASWMN